MFISPFPGNKQKRHKPRGVEKPSTYRNNENSAMGKGILYPVTKTTSKGKRVKDSKKPNLLRPQGEHERKGRLFFQSPKVRTLMKSQGKRGRLNYNRTHAGGID